MAKKTKTLKAPKGTDEANIGGTSYRVNNDGTIKVPEDEVGPLLKTGGFVEVVEPGPLPDGYAYVVHDDESASCSVGERFEAGHIVPVFAVADLIAHGFRATERPATPVPDSPATDGKKTDGPTVAEWVAEGYDASFYPPSGYESKSSQEEIDAAIALQKEEAEAKAKEQADADAAAAAAAAKEKE